MHDFKYDEMIENFLKKDLSRKRKKRLSSWGSKKFFFADERGYLTNKSITFQVLVIKQSKNTQKEKQGNDLCAEGKKIFSQKSSLPFSTKWRNSIL